MSATAPVRQLSFAQRRLWFLDQLAPGGTEYLVVFGWRLLGTLDVEALQHALGTVVARHEVLRTTFGTRNGEPYLVVADPAPVRIPVLAVEPDQLVPTALELSGQPFDLATGPVWRAHLLRASATEHLLVFAAHHVAMDAWSAQNLVDELAEVYRAAREHRQPRLPELALQYAEVAGLQRQNLTEDVLREQLDYWRQQLAGLAPLDLPADLPRSRDLPTDGAAIDFAIPPETVAGLRRLAHQERATLFMVLLAAVQLVLSKQTGGTDIALGMPIVNRDEEEAEPLIGFFANTLVLRGDLSGNPTFRELLRRCRETTLAALEHKDVPFERLVEELKPDRDVVGTPFFQAMLVMNTAFGRLSLPDLEVELCAIDPPQQAKYELTVAFVDESDGLQTTLRYNAALFQADRMRQLADQLVRLLARVVADADRPVSELAVLGDAQRRQVLDWSSAAPAAEPCLLHELVQRQAVLRPDAPAVTGPDGETLGYRELNARANRLARALRRAGVGPEVPVAVCLPRSTDWLIALLAVLKAGGVYLPVDPDYPAQRRELLLAEAAAAVLLVDSATAGLVPADFAGTVLSVDRLGSADGAQPSEASEDDSDLNVELPLEAGAYVVFTSGSTGRPKGVLASHANLSSRIRALLADYRIGPDDTAVALSAIGFDASLREVFATLSAGARLVLAGQGIDPAAVLALLARERVSLMPSVVPSVLSALAEHPVAAGSLSALRLVLCSGERLRPERLAGCDWLDGKLVNQFGPTETTMTATRHWLPAGFEPAWNYPVGRPAAGTTSYVLDAGLAPCPPGVPGELYLGGPGVVRGYLGRPGSTAERFLPNPFGPGRLYRTGDRCRWSADGTLEYLGRLDQQVKVRGIRVEPAEIEAALRGLDGIADAVVVAEQPPSGEVRLIGYLVPRPGQQPSVSALREAAEHSLPAALVPTAWVLLPKLPLTANGKVDRAALPPPDSARPSLATGYVPPADELEQSVADIWGSVLDLDRVGAADNFFDLGGHSLLATRVVSRVSQLAGIEVPLRALFAAPTVAGLSRWIAEHRIEDDRNCQQLRAIARVDRQAELPLSFAQQRLWFLDQFNPDSGEYLIPIAWRLTGQLDVEALREALSFLVARHEVLRTTFTATDGRPSQRVHPPAPVVLPVTEGADDEVAGLISELRERPFDLSTGPLWRPLLIRTGPTEHVFALILHHIVADAWSAGVLLAELSAGYRAALAGQPVALPELAVQYADFAAWQRERLSGPVLAEQLDYWRQALAGAPVLDLPADRPQAAVRDSAGASVEFEIGAELAGALRSLARERQVTLFTVLLAAVQVLLGRYAGQDDVVIGTPIANRNRPEIEPLIGFFVNTLVLRGDLSGNPSFAELLERDRELTLGAYEHQDLPFERLVEELQPNRDLSRTPLFQTLLSVDNTAGTELELPGVLVSDYPLAAETARFDLTLAFAELPDRLHATVRYSSALFDADRIERLTGHLSQLLAGVVADPDVRLSELPLLGPAERQHVLGWSAGEDLPQDEGDPTSDGRPEVLRLIERQAASTPDAVAVTDLRSRLSFAELDDRANRLAHRLRELGAGPEQVVGLCLPRSADALVAMLAAWKSGAAYLPMDPCHPADRLGYQLADAGCRLLISRPEMAGSIPFQGQLLDIAEEWAEPAGRPAGPPELASTPDALAYLIYTSGSTGRPKGVQVTHGGLANYLRWASASLPLTRTGGALLHSSLAFDMTVTSVFIPLSLGRSVCLVDDGVDPAGILAAGAESEASFVKFTPTHLRMLAGCDSPRFPPMVISGGEALPVAVAHNVLANLPTGGLLVNHYGPTEAVVGCCTFTASEPAELTGLGDSVPIGRPIANTQLYVLDPAMSPCAAGVPGELYIGGAGLARGYAGRPDLTAERFVPNPFGPGRLYRTGDLARWSAGGLLHYLGRRDSQVKLRGYRIELGEIEAQLRALPAIAEAAVLVRPDGSGEQRLVGYLVPAGERPTVTELRDWLAGRLPSYEIPSAFVFLDRMPLSGSGKLDLRALPDPDAARPDLADQLVQPRTPAEERVAGVWREVLGLAELGVFDNFFALGGHSLLATQVVSRLAGLTGREVSLRMLFQAPTVAGLTAALESAEPAAGEPSAPEPAITRVARTEAMPLSFAQQRLWFLDQLQPGSAEYISPLAWRLSGRLDVAALRAAIARVVARHEVLRSTVRTVDGKATQHVAPAGEVPLEVRAAPGASEAELVELVERFAYQPFDLGGRLWRAMLVETGPAEHTLVFAMHHIVADAWSSGVLLNELSEHYRAEVAGTPAELPELPIQYADFASWQRARLSGPVLEHQLGYWRSTLTGLAPLELPTDRPRATLRSTAGAAVEFGVPSEVVSGLRRLAGELNGTLFMVLLAGLQAVLARYAGQDDVAVGTPIANRNRAELEPLIGFFINTLVLRTDLAGDPTFRELVRRVREVTLGAYEHQDLPFERLVDELRPTRDLSRTPLFQVMLSVDNTPPAQWRLPDVRAAELPLGSQQAKFDLTVAFDEAGDDLSAAIRYSTALFDAGRIERMAAHLCRLLAGAVENPDVRLSELPLLTEPECRQLLGTGTGTVDSTTADIRILHQLVEAQAGRLPDHLAVADTDGGGLTYAELNARANRLAHRLIAMGAGAERLVGICMTRSVDTVVSLLAVLKTGAAYLPLDPDYPTDRLAFILADAEADIVLTDTELMPGLAKQVLDLADPATQAELAGEPVTDPGATVRADNIAYVIYTSGSTGKPKGVLVSHANACRLFEVTAAGFGFDEQQVWLSTHSYAFDFSVWEIWGALTTGGRVVMASSQVARDPQRLAAVIAEQRVSMLSQTPTAFRALMPELLRAGPADLRHVVFGGEALDLVAVRPWFADPRTNAVRLVNMYGITETTVHVTWLTLTAELPGDAAASPIGRPLDDLRTYVLDRHLAPVPIGVAGELYVGGAGLSRGYLGRPGLTADRFLPDPFGNGRLYRTGDVARWTAEGTLQYLGRSDHQVKIRGFRIELGEIEARLIEHPEVAEAVVVAREDEPGERRLVGYLVARRPTDGAELSPSVLREWLEQTLPGYMVPAAFVQLDELPLTASGKLDRAALPAPGSYRPRLNVGFAEPRTESERLLAGIWAGVLGLDQVGIHDNFFDLGGDSILSIQIVARAVAAGLAVTPQLVFEHQTVAEMAAAAGRRAPVPTEPVAAVAEAPLTPIQRWFFARQLPRPDHYNQSVLLTVPAELTAERLAELLAGLAERHDALRLRFGRPAGDWIQRPGEQPAEGLLRTLDISDAGDRREELLTEAADELQASLDIGTGRVFAGLLADLGDRGRRLLLVAHHLVMDGVSWRILLDDLQAAYRGAPAAPASTSYLRWASLLADYAASPAAAAELPYWQAVVAGGGRLHRDSDGANTVSSAAELSVELSRQRTQALLQDVSAGYRTRINDVLLTALALTLRSVTSGDSLLVDVEGHGREALFGGVDLSRTVGWFTSIYPVRLRTAAGWAVPELLKDTKQKLREIPNGGLGYGVLRYLTPPEVLPAGDQPLAGAGSEVLFNYLGQFDSVLSGERAFAGAAGSKGRSHAAAGSRSHLLEINCEISGGRFAARFGYSRNVHTEATVSRLAEDFLSRLAAVIDAAPGPAAAVPADFPLAGLDQESLDALLHEYGGKA